MLQKIIKWFTPAILSWATGLIHGWMNRRQDKKEQKVWEEKVEKITTLHLQMEQAKEDKNEAEIIRLHILMSSE